jgi:hypothetical protein
MERKRRELTYRINYEQNYQRVHGEILKKIEGQGIIAGIRHYRKLRNKIYYDKDSDREGAQKKKIEIISKCLNKYYEINLNLKIDNFQNIESSLEKTIDKIYRKFLRA